MDELLSAQKKYFCKLNADALVLNIMHITRVKPDRVVICENSPFLSAVKRRYIADILSRAALSICPHSYIRQIDNFYADSSTFSTYSRAGTIQTIDTVQVDVSDALRFYPRDYNSYGIVRFISCVFQCSRKYISSHFYVDRSFRSLRVTYSESARSSLKKQ